MGFYKNNHFAEASNTSVPNMSCHTEHSSCQWAQIKVNGFDTAGKLYEMHSFIGL